MDKWTKAELEQRFGFYKNKILHIFNGDYCLYHKGDLTVDQLNLNYESLPLDDTGKAAGIIVDGQLTVNSNLINADWDEGPFLVVTGDVKAKNVVAGGSEIYIKGNLTAADLVWTEYNHGSCRVDGDLTTQLLICKEHNTTVSGAVNAAFIGVNPLGKLKAKKVKDYTDVLVKEVVTLDDEGEVQLIDTMMLLRYIMAGKQVVDIVKPVNLPQFEAVKSKEWDKAKALIEEGAANVHDVNEYRQTLLHIAAQKGKIDMIQLLLAKGAAINAVDKKDNSPLSLATQYAGAKTVQFLLENGADAKLPKKNFSPLVSAVTKDNKKCIDLLLQYGAYLDSGNQYGRTALGIACHNRDAGLAKRLIEAGADINRTDDYDQSSLQLAAESGLLDIVKTLVEKGANVNHTSIAGETALTEAVKKGFFDIVQYLVENNADINVGRDSLGANTLSIAIYSHQDKIAEYLLAKGVDVRRALYFGVYWDGFGIVEWLNRKGYDVLGEFNFEDLWFYPLDRGVKQLPPKTLLGVAEYRRKKGEVNDYLKALMKKS